ncbi:MAG TPA: nucleotidyltransferase family protein [Steroidobacteraceae bacterium]|jgi:MurNAc alpha-1-phosphate uridylyltransferase|nr:nucleotidyltransferase family protein [Steroidobacteraceae bacterium]
MTVRRAMILAAGRGERMRPLTDRTPKPLLEVRGKPLIVYHLERLCALGLSEVVINLAWLGNVIRERLGDGARWNLHIRYSDEGAEPLETGGGVFKALPWLGPDPFLIVNGDVFTDYDFAALRIAPEAWAQLVLVPNPPQGLHGDFSLRDGFVVDEPGAPRWTYSGIGLYRPELFTGCVAGRFKMLPVFQRAIIDRRLQGEIYTGLWNDVGTADRLSALQ